MSDLSYSPEEQRKAALKKQAGQGYGFMSQPPTYGYNPYSTSNKKDYGAASSGAANTTASTPAPWSGDPNKKGYGDGGTTTPATPTTPAIPGPKKGLLPSTDPATGKKTGSIVNPAEPAGYEPPTPPAGATGPESESEYVEPTTTATTSPAVPVGPKGQPWGVRQDTRAKFLQRRNRTQDLNKLYNKFGM